MRLQQFLFGSFVALSFLITSCDDNVEPKKINGGDKDPKKGMPRLDISNATSLVVMGSSANSGGRSLTETSNLI